MASGTRQALRRSMKLVNGVFAVSTREVDMRQVRNFVERVWDQVMMDGGVLLVLGGVHGDKDGNVSQRDIGLEKDIDGQIRILKREKRSELMERNIKIVFEKVGNHLRRNAGIDEEKFVAAVEKHEPTTIVFSYCFTHVSSLNLILQSRGILSSLIIRKERGEIAARWQCLTLSEEQQQFLQAVGNHRPRHVILTGMLGSGKSLLLLEALRTKLAQFRREDTEKKIKVFITTGRYIPQALDYLKLAFDLERCRNVEVEFLTSARDIKGQFMRVKSFCTLDDPNYVATIVQQLSQSYKQHKVFFVADEIDSWRDDKSGWVSFSPAAENVDVLLAFHPHWEWDDVQKSGQPVRMRGSTLSCHLQNIYRNSHDVLRLVVFLSRHDGDRAIYPAFPLRNLLQDPASLPGGSKPTWFHLEEEFSLPCQITCQMVAERALPEDFQSASFVFWKDIPPKDVRDWAKKTPKIKCYHGGNSDGKQEGLMRGLEDENVVVVACSRLWHPSNLIEAVTRARGTCAVVTNQETDGKVMQMLRKAAKPTPDNCTCEMCKERTPLIKSM